MPDPTLYESTYQWDCNACHTKVLAIRSHEKNGPLVSVACPSCGFRILVTPSIRREERQQPVAVSNIAHA
jgi:DNA-directed RNA polymerase subunit RPC12/RpoP